MGVNTNSVNGLVNGRTSWFVNGVVCLQVFFFFVFVHFVISKNDEKNWSKRICIKVCFKLEKSYAETSEMMKTAFEDIELPDSPILPSVLRQG